MISHLALIMDGNRRWAKQHAMLPWLGHRQGAKCVEMVIKYCIDNHIPHVSLYTLSIENLKRSAEEIAYLFALIQEVQTRCEEFIKSGVKVRFVGNLSLLPEDTRKSCEMIQQATAQCDVLMCNFLLCYGGQQEILAAIQSLIDQKCSNVTTEDLKKSLWLGDIPDPDLIVRTGGVKRLSNFLLFQCAYSEIRFLDCLWPDLTKELLHSTIENACGAHKNFGQ